MVDFKKKSSVQTTSTASASASAVSAHAPGKAASAPLSNPTPPSIPRRISMEDKGVIVLEDKVFMFNGKIYDVKTGTRATDPGSIYILETNGVKVRPINEGE